jgi:predicted TIM-barrel fold metal-dependent hydrolase
VTGGPPACPPEPTATPVSRGFALLEKLGLTFDAWAYQSQLDLVIDLARAFPRQPIVMGHTGGVLGVGKYAGRRDELFASWRRSIRQLSQCANVSMKLGGLGMKRCGFEFFGTGAIDVCRRRRSLAAVDRRMHRSVRRKPLHVQSNFPVDRASASYRVLWNAFKRIASRGSASERRISCMTRLRAFTVSTTA